MTDPRLGAGRETMAAAQQARSEDGVLVTPAPDGRGRSLIKFLVDSGHTPDSVSERQKDLEDIFLSLTEDKS